MSHFPIIVFLQPPTFLTTGKAILAAGNEFPEPPEQFAGIRSVSLKEFSPDFRRKSRFKAGFRRCSEKRPNLQVVFASRLKILRFKEVPLQAIKMGVKGTFEELEEIECNRKQ